MSEARAEILARIRAALGRGELDAEARAALEARATAEVPPPPRPRWSQSRIERFLDRLAAAAASCDRLAETAAVPATVAAYLDGHGLAPPIAVAPALAELDWPEALQPHFGPVRGEHAVSVTPCELAVAETGSLVLLSSAASPTSLNFLPDDHIVVLHGGQVVDYMEEVWAHLRRLPEFPPRTVNFITGPSRTADVEQTIQLGAHGPRRLHVLLVED